VEADPRLLKETKMDDNEPIFYAARYRNSKIFKYILDLSTDINYDVSNMLIFEIDQ
jgi:hypothetical protein